MLFSVIVPVYKVEEYLGRCVDALLNQSYGDIEIILVDDGSPDNCPVLCDEYAKADDRIKVIHKENGGLSDARNAGLKAATGDYIIFVDSDDYIKQDACQKLLPFTAQNCDIIVADAVVEGASINLSHLPADGTVYTGAEYFKKAALAGRCPMAAWLNIYRRRFLLDNGLLFKYGILHEDEQFTPRALLGAKTVVISGVDFYHYIVRDNSITTQKDKRKNAKDLYDTCLELEGIYKSLADKQLKTELLDSLARKYLSMFQTGALYRYGKEYLHKGFVVRNAYKTKTKAKAYLYALCPRLYYKINAASKRR